MAGRHLRSVLVLTGLLLILGTVLPGGAVGAPPGVHVVASGLHSPRGLSFGPGGILYVAEAGDATHASAIQQIRNSASSHPIVRTVVGGLPSIGEDGEFIGLAGISVLGRGGGQSIYAITGLSPQATGNQGFGALLRVGSDGSARSVANVGAFMYDWTADHSDLWEEFPDSNPYGVLAVPGHVYVTDAGANTLNEVHPDGSIDVLAYFPNTPIRDAIPTCVARGPDGSLYIGTLVLVESVVFGPSAIVYRVDPADVRLDDPTKTPAEAWATGLWPINGCTIANGSFYASQMFTGAHDFDTAFGDPHGDVVRIPLNAPGTHTMLAGGTLGLAGGVAVGPNGGVYVADGTAFAPNGRVVRLAGN